MRIAIFTDTFLPQINGVVTATINLAKGLADRGHKVWIFAPKFRNTKEFKHKNVYVKRNFSVPAGFYEDFKFTSPIGLSIIKEIRRNNIQAVHFQTPITLGVQAIIIAKLLRLPLIGTFHTFFADEEYLKHVKFNNKIAQRIMWEYSNIYYNRCTLVTCPSGSTKKELVAHGCKKSIKVISNGIDFDMFDNRKAGEVKKKYGPDDDLLLFIGRIAHEKNIGYLLECFSRAIRINPNMKLLMVGDGPQMKEAKRMILDLDIRKKVVMLGRIPHSNLVRSGIFGACKLFVTASRTENQPMTMLEAQANGLVCVALNSRGIPDLVKDRHNGFLVKEGDKEAFARAIVNILRDEALYDKMRGETIRRVQEHSITKVIDGWERIYSSLINKKKNQSKTI